MISAAYWGAEIAGTAGIGGADVVLGKDDYVAAVDCGLMSDSYSWGGNIGVRVGNVYSIRAATKAVSRYTISSPWLPEARYEIRCRRTTPNSEDDLVLDELMLNEVAEVISDDVAYINTALLAVKIKMDEQVSGLPKVTAEIGGRVIDVYDRKTGWRRENSSNPAWITFDAMTNRVYGGGMAATRFNFDQLLEWSEHCDKERLKFNGVIDGESNLWEATKLFARVGMAQLVRTGTRFGFAIERPAEPVMVFNSSNIVEGSFSQEWASTSERSNEFEVTYQDIDDDYKQRTVRVVDEAAIRRGEPRRTASVTVPGIVEEADAYRHAWLMLNMNMHLQQSVRFGAQLDAIACSVGDVILVQHDQPIWGHGGKFGMGSTADAVVLDREVELEVGQRHRLLCVFPALKVADMTVQSAVGDTLILSAPAMKKATRLVHAGRDVRIVEWGAVTSLTSMVKLAERLTVSAGEVVQLWATDVIEERDVSYVRTDNGRTVAHLMAPFSAAPGRHLTWTLGSLKAQRKPFRVVSMDGAGMESREISALEYNETIYTSKPAPTASYSGLSNEVAQSSIAGVYEELELIGNVLQPFIVVEFGNKSPAYKHSEIQVLRGGSWDTVGAHSQRVRFSAAEGETLKIRAVAVSVLNAKARPSDAHTVTHTVAGKSLPPEAVTGLTVKKRQTDLMVEWLPNSEPDIAGYDVREGLSWDSARLIATNVKATSVITDLEHAGTYYFMAKAVDTSGNSSNEPAIFKLELREPSAVRDFDVVQSGDSLIFQWRPNDEKDLAGYEIREGEGWSQSRLVATGITNNRMSLAVGGNQARRFLIKSIVSPGIYSAKATYVDVEHRDTQARNLVLNLDKEAERYAGGTLVNMVVRPDKGIEMTPGSRYGEFLFRPTLPKKIRARNVPSYTLRATKVDGDTWSTATWPWNSDSANRTWELAGEARSVSSDVFIALKLPAPRLDGVVDSWSFDGNLASIKGAPATRTIGAKYVTGRFGDGLNVSPMTDVRVPVAGKATFSAKAWFRVGSMDGACRVWAAFTADGKFVELIYRPEAKAMFLRDWRYDEELRLAIDLRPGDLTMIAIVQTGTGRRIMAGIPGTSTVGVAESSRPPIGPIVSMMLS